MNIRKPDGTLLLNAIVTKSAEHVQELMKPEYVKLSWSDAEHYIIPAGSYITPYADITDIDGNPARFTLYKDYVPEETVKGYVYNPEFLHPLMWLSYVPITFDTLDGAGESVKKTEYNYVGRLSDLINQVVAFINNALGLTTGRQNENATAGSTTEFMPIYSGVDSTQTVSVYFTNMDVLSAMAEIANVVGCEYHFDWKLKFLYFGDVTLGSTPYQLVVGQNVNDPSVQRSTEQVYNSFLVYGSTRNNFRVTEDGNNVATGTRLTQRNIPTA